MHCVPFFKTAFNILLIEIKDIKCLVLLLKKNSFLNLCAFFAIPTFPAPDENVLWLVTISCGN
jgi:hypothetical protein